MSTPFVFFGRSRRALLALGVALWCAGSSVAVVVGGVWGAVVLTALGLPGAIVALAAAAPLFAPGNDRS